MHPRALAARVSIAQDRISAAVADLAARAGIPDAAPVFAAHRDPAVSRLLELETLASSLEILATVTVDEPAEEEPEPAEEEPEPKKKKGKSA